MQGGAGARDRHGGHSALHADGRTHLQGSRHRHQGAEAPGGSALPGSEFLVNHTRDMEKLKELLTKKERMRAMLKDAES
eukprot:11196324-Alexandrium_andersonii.AAC.1